MLATIEVLEKEKVEYQERVDFLKNYIIYLENEDNYESKDKAYKLSKELNFKESLIIQREQQIKQAKEQEELKKKCIEEFPSVLDKAKEAYNTMLDDLEKVKKAKKTKEIVEFKKNLEAQIDKTDVLIEGIEARFDKDNDHNSVINDFRQLHEIIKFVK